MRTPQATCYVREWSVCMGRDEPKGRTPTSKPDVGIQVRSGSVEFQAGGRTLDENKVPVFLAVGDHQGGSHQQDTGEKHG